jgi:hypothetical protein
MNIVKYIGERRRRSHGYLRSKLERKTGHTHYSMRTAKLQT